MYTAVTCDEILHLYCDVGSGDYWIAVGNETLHLCTAKYNFLHKTLVSIIGFYTFLLL